MPTLPINHKLPLAEAFGTKDIVAMDLSFVADAEAPTELLQTSMDIQVISCRCSFQHNLEGAM